MAEKEDVIITRDRDSYPIICPKRTADMWKDFGCREGEDIITWLLECWDDGTSDLKLDDREARQL